MMFEIKFAFFDPTRCEPLLNNILGWLDQFTKIIQMIVDINVCMVFAKLAFFFFTKKKEVLDQ